MASDIDPRHAIGLVLLLVVVGSGTAVGLNVVGLTLGESVTVTEQAVIVPPDNLSTAHVTADDTVVSVNDEGTQFQTAAEVHQGETYRVRLPVHNRGEGEVTLKLVMQQTKGPGDLELDVQPTGFAELNDPCMIDRVVKVEQNEWWLTMDGECKDRVDLVVSVPATSQPGFYRAQGTIKPVEEI